METSTRTQRIDCSKLRITWLFYQQDTLTSWNICQRQSLTPWTPHSAYVLLELYNFSQNECLKLNWALQNVAGDYIQLNVDSQLPAETVQKRLTPAIGEYLWRNTLSIWFRLTPAKIKAGSFPAWSMSFAMLSRSSSPNVKVSTTGSWERSNNSCRAL